MRAKSGIAVRLIFRRTSPVPSNARDAKCTISRCQAAERRGEPAASRSRRLTCVLSFAASRSSPRSPRRLVEDAVGHRELPRYRDAPRLAQLRHPRSSRVHLASRSLPKQRAPRGGSDRLWLGIAQIDHFRAMHASVARSCAKQRFVADWLVGVRRTRLAIVF